LEFLNSTVLGRSYQDDIFVGDINNGALYRFELNENRSALGLEGSLADTVADSPDESEQVTFGKGFGGITDIETGPDGYLYVLSFTEGAIFRIAPADETPTVAATAELTVKSTDLSGAEITGMYVTIRSEHGELEETGYTPLTFAGVIGSEYVMTAADFENRKFEHWENGDSAREKSITLERDTAVTAVYRITQVNDSAVDLGTNSLDNVIALLANTDCIDDNEEKKIAKSLEKIIKQLIGRDDRTIGKLEKTLSGIAESCLEDEDDDNGSRHGLGKGHKDDNSGRGSDDEDDD
ncbi:MAG TPA: hypothetical protein VLA68_00880, partial [Nitrososphaera sp.]|nr:hypothetical protein [Nitrososphaera sp.]